MTHVFAKESSLSSYMVQNNKPAKEVKSFLSFSLIGKMEIAKLTCRMSFFCRSRTSNYVSLDLRSQATEARSASWVFRCSFACMDKIRSHVSC